MYFLGFMSHVRFVRLSSIGARCGQVVVSSAVLADLNFSLSVLFWQFEIFGLLAGALCQGWMVGLSVCFWRFQLLGCQ